MTLRCNGDIHQIISIITKDTAYIIMTIYIHYDYCTIKAGGYYDHNTPQLWMITSQWSSPIPSYSHYYPNSLDWLQGQFTGNSGNFHGESHGVSGSDCPIQKPIQWQDNRMPAIIILPSCTIIWSRIFHYKASIFEGTVMESPIYTLFSHYTPQGGSP